MENKSQLQENNIKLEILIGELNKKSTEENAGAFHVLEGTIRIEASSSTTIPCSNAKYAVVSGVVIKCGEESDYCRLEEDNLYIENPTPSLGANYTYYIFCGDEGESPSGGITLPTLDNPASTEHITKDYQAIDSEGNIITGTHECPTLQEMLPSLSNPATSDKISSGYQVINSLGEVLTGTMEASSYHIDTSKFSPTSRQEGKDQTFTCTATGSEIVLAIIYHENQIGTGEKLSGVGTLLESTNTRIYDGNISSSISYTGNTVTVELDADDVVYGEDWYVWVLSR